LDHEFLYDLGENVEYHHLKGKGGIERCRFLADRTATKYSILHGDDEFFLPSSLEAQIGLLEENEDYIACIGQCISFRLKDNNVVSEITYPEFKNYEISCESPERRLGYHMQHYTPSLIYSVTRSEYWKRAFDLVSQANQVSFWAGGEILVEMALAYLGKSKVIGTLGWLRSKENERIQGKGAHERQSSRFTTWWESDEMENERELFTQLFAQKISEVDGRPVSEIKQEACEGLKSYYGFSKNYHSGRHWFNRPETMEEPMMDLAKKLMSSGVEVNLGELEEVKQIIMDFHRRPKAQTV
jgi:glycosyltransferase domain-containing protein